MAVRVAPTFLLKGVDPKEVLKSYYEGKYTRQPNIKSKITIANNTAIIAPIYGNDSSSPIYCIKDRHNSTVIIATSNHANYELHNKTGDQLPIGGRCKSCMEDFDHITLGYPLAYRETSLLTNVEGSEPVYRTIYSFWLEGTFCSFECVASYIIKVLSQPADNRDTTMRDSYRMLTLLFTLMHPNAGPLRPAQDSILHVREGGSLTDEQWKDKRHIYVRTNRIHIAPLKTEYIQQQFSEPSIIGHTRPL